MVFNPVAQVRKEVWNYYRAHGRYTLPWRNTTDPYRILVSEVMLQQTQVDRVVPYYKSFLKQFKTIRALARAPLKDVLRVWQGLGYSRRAKFLHLSAQTITDVYKGRVPREYDTLCGLPGVGPYTAHAVRVFAYNTPGVLLETNIRTVLLHHFFSHNTNVHDRLLIPVLEKLVFGQDPRTFYWALMDYGSYLKKTHTNPSRKSAHYTKQSSFNGSRRQVRGAILRLLHTHAYSTVQLQRLLHDERVPDVLSDLRTESLVRFSYNKWRL